MMVWTQVAEEVMRRDGFRGRTSYWMHFVVVEMREKEISR